MWASKLAAIDRGQQLGMELVVLGEEDGCT
jgi:hypothetical protein